MTKYIIIEDERLAYEEIRRMMQRLRPDYTLVGWAAGIEQAILQLTSGGIDLMIVDIRLSDGLSFEIFERTEWIFRLFSLPLTMNMHYGHLR